MKKLKSKNNRLSKIIICILLFLVIIGILIIQIINYFIPYYKVEGRVENIEKFEGIEEEKPLGWLRVQGTNIDFPIVYYEDVDVTLPDYELGWSYSGDTSLDKKVTIFSHNILNVSSNPLIGNENHKRFEQLMAYVYTDFVKENKYIQYTIDGKDYLYKIYGVSFQKEASLDYENTSPSKEEAKKYIDNTKEKSYFDFDIDVNENDKLITLVTCTRFFGETTEYSFVVDARLVRENETVKNYKVIEKKNYNKIKKIMKGDVSNA